MYVVLSGMFIGLFWQQSGWLAHDFLHHQVDSERKWNNIFGGYILGDVAQVGIVPGLNFVPGMVFNVHIFFLY